MRFSKYHGLGNDFIVADARGDEAWLPDPDAARRLCDRRFGVGADGVLYILPPRTPGAIATLRILNADGSEAEMCGNGLRCVARHLWEREPAVAGAAVLAIDTGAGRLSCTVQAGGDDPPSVTVDMGAARLARGEIPMTGPASERAIEIPIATPAGELAMTAVSMGNPHAVAFVDEAGAALRALAETVGPAIEHHVLFPNRINVELARLISRTEIELLVWERGCGITLACGTGACATAAAACATGRADPDSEITVHLLGGDLAVTVAPDLSRVTMRGPATHIYDATLANE
ncbi:MAG TPA: diaminopimelate epimerase [Kofleriaceae bacterium]|nr:diaminopimelate epimerase [Kofleriaceae bacterium]